MTTGNFWDVTNPKKPVGEFDGDDIIDIPFDVAAFMTGAGDTYASHTIIPDLGLQCASSAFAAGFIVTRIKKDPVQTLTVGAKYGVTWRVVGTSGQSKDATLYLKIVTRQVNVPQSV